MAMRWLSLGWPGCSDALVPLFFVLEAGGVGSKAHYLSREVLYGMLAMDSFYLQ